MNDKPGPSSMASPPASAAYLAESRVWQLHVFYSLAIALELFTTLFRLWIKKNKHKGPGHWSADDLFVVVATCFAMAEAITGFLTGPPHGLGRHIEAVSKEDLSTLLLGNYIFGHLYSMANGMTKLSILAVYYRVFSTSRFRVVVLCTAAVLAAWMVAMELLMGFGCRPVQAWWGALPKGTPYHCIDKVALSYFINGANLFTNLWIFSMPVPIIVRLKMTVDKRVCLVVLFSIGLCTCGFSAARLRVIAEADKSDLTWNGVEAGIVSVWEPCCGILCANLPIVCAPIVEAIKRIKARSQKRSGAHTLPGGDPNTDEDEDRFRMQGLSGEVVSHSSMPGRREGVDDVELLGLGMKRDTQS